MLSALSAVRDVRAVIHTSTASRKIRLILHWSQHGDDPHEKIVKMSKKCNDPLQILKAVIFPVGVCDLLHVRLYSTAGL